MQWFCLTPLCPSPLLLDPHPTPHPLLSPPPLGSAPPVSPLTEPPSLEPSRPRPFCAPPSPCPAHTPPLGVSSSFAVLVLVQDADLTSAATMAQSSSSSWTVRRAGPADTPGLDDLIVRQRNVAERLGLAWPPVRSKAGVGRPTAAKSFQNLLYDAIDRNEFGVLALVESAILLVWYRRGMTLSQVSNRLSQVEMEAQSSSTTSRVSTS